MAFDSADVPISEESPTRASRPWREQLLTALSGLSVAASATIAVGMLLQGGTQLLVLVIGVAMVGVLLAVAGSTDWARTPAQGPGPLARWRARRLADAAERLDANAKAEAEASRRRAEYVRVEADKALAAAALAEAHRDTSDPAFHELRIRYVRGEVTREQFDYMRQVLRATRAAAPPVAPHITPVQPSSPTYWTFWRVVGVVLMTIFLLWLIVLLVSVGALVALFGALSGG